MEAVLDIIKTKLGGAKGVSDALGDLSPQAVSQWDKVPVNRVLRLEALTGISRHKIRPDIYGKEPSTKTKRVETAQ